MGQLEIGRVLSAIVTAYQRRLGVLLTVSFVFALVNGILGGILQGVLPLALSYPLSFALNYFIITLFVAVVLQLVIDLREGRGQRTAGALFSAIGPSLGSLLLLGLIYGLGVGVGLLLILVPGLYLMTIWSVSAPAVMVERLGAVDSLRRSRELVSGNGWQVFGVLAILFAVSIVAIILVAGVLTLLLGLTGLIIGAVIVKLFIQPLEALARAVIYFELIRIKEGGVASAAPVPGGTAPQQSAPPPPPAPRR
jgi:hypothetical protein